MLVDSVVLLMTRGQRFSLQGNKGHGSESSKCSTCEKTLMSKIAVAMKVAKDESRARGQDGSGPTFDRVQTRLAWSKRLLVNNGASYVLFNAVCITTSRLYLKLHYGRAKSPALQHLHHPTLSSSSPRHSIPCP